MINLLDFVPQFASPIIGKLTVAKKREDVFQLFEYDGEEITRYSEMLADEKLGKSKALELLNYALGIGMGNLRLVHFFLSGHILFGVGAEDGLVEEFGTDFAQEVC